MLNNTIKIINFNTITHFKEYSNDKINNQPKLINFKKM